MKEFVCKLCPRRCGALRGASGAGVCGMGMNPVVARVAPHHDEEPVISGNRGSGAVFFSGCSLQCRFCQNYTLSHERFGREITVSHLRELYFKLIAQGVHNINLVNPTHFASAIRESLEGGLPVPVIWNTGGYERVETIRAMKDRVQVYLPDLKYIDPRHARRYSNASDYFACAAPAIAEMLRQTGPVELDDDGIIRRGTIIRHLILPGCAEESCRILDYIADHFKGAWISLMAQYLPFGDCSDVDELGRRLTQEEYDRVADHLEDLGLEEGFIQELSSSDEKYIPNFDLTGIE